MGWAQAGVPLPIEELLPKLHGTEEQAARAAHVAHYIHTSLERAERARARSQQSVEARGNPEVLSAALEGAADTMTRSIQFDDDSSTTEVTVSSRFEVKEEQAHTILTSAHPPEWQNAAADFFKCSVPVVYEPASGRIEVHRENASLPRYQLYEQVEWDWSESTEGGLANILTIRQDPTHSLQKYQRCLESLREGSLLLEPGPFEQVVKKAFHERWKLVEYKFELFRSLRSKFVANWELGGLDVDEGAYVALWSPDTGRLYIKTNKRLRYSAGAGGIEGFSSMLNLLAPATVGMLLENLAYQGILEYLNPD
jgi:hypothetical protein